MNKQIKTYKIFIQGVQIGTEFWEQTPAGKIEYYYQPCAGFTTRDKIRVNKPSTLDKQEV